MGRGTNNGPGVGSMPTRGGNDGEIPLLDADRLDDHAEAAIEQTSAATDYGDAADERAIKRLIAKLRKAPSTRGKSAEEIEDRAIDLYRAACDLIESGNASEEQIAKTAALFGEEPQALKARLLGEQDEGGETALLGALFGK